MTVSLQTAPNFGVLAVAFLAVGRNPDVDAYPGHLEQTLMSDFPHLSLRFESFLYSPGGPLPSPHHQRRWLCPTNLHTVAKSWTTSALLLACSTNSALATSSIVRPNKTRKCGTSPWVKPSKRWGSMAWGLSIKRAPSSLGSSRISPPTDSFRPALPPHSSTMMPSDVPWIPSITTG